MKYLVWAAIGFGLYTGWCHLPLTLEPGHLESAVENVLDALDHTSADAGIVDRTWKVVDSKGKYVRKQDIHIRREKSAGERRVEVRFEIPVTVTWLGSSVTRSRPVVAVHRYEVDETAEADRLARIEEGKRLEREQQRLAKGHLDEYRRQVRRECESAGGMQAGATVLVTFDDGSRKMVPCNVLDRW